MHISPAKSDKPHDYVFRTPVGQALYPHLLTPDTRFDEKGTYKVGLFLEPAEIDAAREALTRIYRQAYPDEQATPHLPIKMEGDRPYVLAKSTYQPKLLDPDRKVIPEQVLVANGHKIRLFGRARPFKSAFATGVALYLSGVEIHESLNTLERYRGAKPATEAGAPAEIRTGRPPAFVDEFADIPF